MVDNDLCGVLKSFSAREIAAMLPKLLYEDEYYSVALIDISSGGTYKMQNDIQQ